MAVFRYKMQGILDIKEKLEDRAKQEFAEANMRLDAEKKKLDELQARKFYYMQEGVKLRMELIDVRKIRENKMAVLKMDEYIADQMREIARAAKAVEKARAALQELMQERKAHEKLKPPLPISEREGYPGGNQYAGGISGKALPLRQVPAHREGCGE